MDLPLHLPSMPHPPFHPSVPLSRVSSVLPTNCSSYLTCLGTQTSVSGAWYELHSRIVHPYLPHVSRTDGSLLSSTHSITTMYNSMHPTSVSGYNITIQTTLPHPHHQWQHTSSNLPTHWQPMPHDCHWFPSATG
jgi:hypothetical protein